jgi:hypothetical protein
VSHDGGSSSRPYTVVSMPAMWYVLDDIADGGVGCKVSRGFGADMMPWTWLGGNNLSKREVLADDFQRSQNSCCKVVINGRRS